MYTILMLKLSLYLEYQDNKVASLVLFKRNNRILYALFWVIPRRLEFICRRFGTLRLFHLHRQVGVSRMN